MRIDNGRWLILFLGLALLLRLFFALNSRDPIIKDGILYDSVAVSLVNGTGYSLDGVHPTTHVPPLYPYILALVYSVFGHNFKIALILQAIIGTIICFLLYKIARELFNDRNIAICALLIGSLYYYLIREGERLWTEPFFIFFIVLSVFYYLRMMSPRGMFYPVAFGLSCAAAALTRPVALFLPFILMAPELLRPGAFRRQAAAALLVFVIPIGLWTARNYAVHKEFMLVATGGGRNFYEAFNPYEGKKYGITVRDDTIREGEAIPSEIARDKFYFEEGLKSIFQKRPAELARLMLLKAATFFSPMDWGPMGDGGAVFNFCTAFILPFSIAALFLLRRNRQALKVLLVPIGYFFLFSMVFMGLPRFRLPAEPFLIILAAYGITRFFRRFSVKSVPALIITSWLGINLLLYFNSAYAKEWLKRIAEASGLW